MIRTKRADIGSRSESVVQQESSGSSSGKSKLKQMSYADASMALQPENGKLHSDPKSIQASKGLTDLPKGYGYVKKEQDDLDHVARVGDDARALRPIELKDGKYADAETGQIFDTIQEVDDYNRVRRMAHGTRPDPKTYIPTKKIEMHLQGFEGGASYLTPKKFLDMYGREKVGRDDGLFVMRSDKIDEILKRADGDISIIEKELGLDPGSWAGEELVRVDIQAPKDAHLRMPTGNEGGANRHWLPGGKLPTGMDEAVVDQIPEGNYTETPIRKR